MKKAIMRILVVMVIVIVSNQVNAQVYHTYSVTICSGNSTTIGNPWPGATVFQWNTTPAQYTQQITVNPTVNTTYIEHIYNGTGLMGIDTFNIVVNPTPNGTVTPSQSICVGTTATLTATGGTNYLWSTGSTAASITVNPSNTTTYFVTITGSNGCSMTLNSTVTVNPIPNGTVTPSQSICAGTTVTLTATGGTSYLWSNGANTASITVTPAATTTYSVVIIGTGGCSVTLSSTVTVNPIPNGTVTPSQSICAGTTVTLTATGGTSYLWSNGANTASITVTPAATTTYSVVITGTGGCSMTLSSMVTVNPIPNGTVTPSQSICAGTTVTLSATGGTSYLWSNGATTASIVVTPTATTTYSVVITGTGGCSVTLSSTVTVNVMPVITYIGSNSPVCSGNNINLSVTTNQTGCTYTWNGPNGFTSTLQNPIIPNATTAASGNYNCVVNIGVCSTTANTSVVVNTTPTINTIGNNGPVCQGSNLSLYSTANAGCTYAWSGPNGFTSILQNPSVPNATVAATGTYNLTVNLNSCFASSNTNATVVSSPNASIGGNLSVCAGISTTLTAYGGTSYLWSNGLTTQSITVSPTATITYSVVVSATGGCSATAFATVVVNPLPNVTISPINPQTCEGTNVTLTASGANTYAWNTGATSQSITVNPNIISIYSVTGTNTSSCAASTNVTVTVFPKPVVVLNMPQVQICIDANPITLNGGYPSGGHYFGSGIFSGLFYPSTVGVGTYLISYEFTNSYGCTATATQLLTVNPRPTVIFNAIYPNPASINSPAFQLNSGVPLGGIYSGPGVVNGWFYPSVAGVGIHTITYTYIDFMSCVGSDIETITVAAGSAGIEDQNSNNKIKLYPSNPVSGYLNIEMAEKPDFVQIVSMTGNVLQTEKVDSEKFRIDVSRLPKGMLFIRFALKDGSMGTAKFIK